MAGMEKVKATIGENDSLSCFPVAMGEAPERSAGLDLIPERGQDLPLLQKARGAR